MCGCETVYGFMLSRGKTALCFHSKCIRSGLIRVKTGVGVLLQLHMCNRVRWGNAVSFAEKWGLGPECWLFGSSFRNCVPGGEGLHHSRVKGWRLGGLQE